jgi:hypothetical protein
VLTKNDAAAFKTAVATGDAQQASTAMMGLTNVPDDLLRGTLAMDDVKESIIGASQSRDFDKYSAAVTTMDNLYNRAPQEFARIFGADAMDTLQDWQGRLRYMNPVELEAEFKRRGDPAYAARQEKLKTEGSVLARKIELPDIAADLGGPMPTDGNIAAVLAADHEAMFSQRFAATQNADTARQQAAERMKQHWGPSVTNNGELMLHPPDRYYPRINGNYDWIETQLKDELFAAGYGYEVNSPRAGTSRVAWPHMLIADAQTESEAAQGKSPSYRIVVTNPHNGETDLLTDRRYNFDPATIQNAATRKAYDDERASIFEWNPLQKFGLYKLKKPGPGTGW